MRPSDLASIPPVEPGPALARGTALGRFMILGLIGRGAMGEVYGAYDPELDRKIAIKLLRARADSAADNRARLMREAKAIAKISHPNVVVVYDAGAFENRVFIAMEFVEGHTLRYWLQVEERTWSDVLDVFLAAGRGLAAAHEKELVHRDFKPDNVMVTAQGGHVRVMDFGLARFVAAALAEEEPPADDLDSTIELSSGLGAAPAAVAPPAALNALQEKITATGAVLGTPAYMSPEQFRSQPADARSDQFSFCVALYEALYGVRPFAGRTLAELSSNVIAGNLSEPPASRRVPAAVRRALARGLRNDPHERFPSMSALLDELGRQSSTGRTSFERGAAAKLAGVWEAPVDGRPVETPGKALMREAFLATGRPYAATAFASASAVLDRFTHRWSELYVEICEATHVRGEQSAEVLDLRMGCLQESLDDLKALCRLFREATGQVVEKAVNAAHALGTLERCNDVKLLRAMVRAPDDDVTRAAVERLRLRLIDVRALQRVGRVAAGLEAVVPLVEEARGVGYGPGLAEALMVKGILQYETSRIDAAVTSFEEAFSEAELARHDEVAATAAIYVAWMLGYAQSRLDAAEVWLRYAETLLRRMGGHDLLWGWFYNSRAAVREHSGRLAEAVADGKASLAAKERALGPKAPDVAQGLLNIGNFLACGCEFDAALTAAHRALGILVDTVGAEHPTMAMALSSQAQFLYRLSRFDEAVEGASAALAIWERETNPRGMFVTVGLRTLGLCRLGQGRPAEAVPVLMRALEIREELKLAPVRLAEVRFPLARALLESGSDRDRALAMARQARAEYGQSPTLPVIVMDIAEADRWLATNG
jgi:tRNA A-37 threonylcarbamoyl transferase component Bud32/tetratricopeptide (TPR) repeat protein